MHTRLFPSLALLLLTATASLAQTTPTKYTIGADAQWYPAGIIATLHGEKYIGAQQALLLRLGGNFADRKDYSPYNGNEKGNGFGGTVGYRRYFEVKTGKILLGANTDVWNMWIHWRNDIGQPNETNGTSYTLVLQPWLEAGYFRPVGNSPVQWGVSAGFGREINIVTEGKDVGQGWMFSLSGHVDYRIGSSGST